MRTIERSSIFKRDYKHESRGEHRSTLDSSLASVLTALVNDEPLETRHRDHDLSGIGLATASATLNRIYC